MRIKQTLSALAVAAATVALGVVPGGGLANAQEPAPAAVTSTSALATGFALRFPRIECVAIFGDFDTDEIIWICEIVWP